MASLNVQGLSRRDIDLMSCLLFDEGKIGFSADLSSGEPTVTSHYSKDKNYIDANFTMVGKEPYYDSNGILKIDDMYLTGASVSPVGMDQMKEAFHSSWGSVPFSKQWLIDPELIKSEPNMKQLRTFHKTIILAIQYGQKPKGTVAYAYSKGYLLLLKDAREFYGKFWYELFPEVRKLGESLEYRWIDKGYLVNEFGFRMFPDRGSKSLNYFIQSTVSGIMNALCLKFFSACPWAEFITIIHDEVIGQIPIGRIEEATAFWQKAVDSLNEDLGWSVAIRSGFVTGENWYTCK